MLPSTCQSKTAFPHPLPGRLSSSHLLFGNAIFTHGKDHLRKMWVLREAMLWHDDALYYSQGNFLTYKPHISHSLRAEGGFQLINEQLRQFGLAMQLARVLNRTLVLPKLHCSDRIMAYPCYAWYHRGYSMKGLNVFKIPMPELCPLYYWLDLRMATASLGGMLREPTFLSNPRVSKEISQDVATLSLTPGDLPHWNPAKESHLRQD
ncbi:MAG: hypothetical protein SGPRY_003028 [Prymnesium sp.]